MSRNYGVIADQLYEASVKNVPDFEEIQRLLNQIEDINALCDYKGKSILSEIITQYPSEDYNRMMEMEDDEADEYEANLIKQDVENVEYYRQMEELDNLMDYYNSLEDSEFTIKFPKYKSKEPVNKVYNNLATIIQMFIDAGFDVHAQNGKVGNECLVMLKYASLSESLEAMKVLLKAGARPLTHGEGASAIEAMGMGESYARSVEYDHITENCYYTLGEILAAAKEDSPFEGYDYYANCIGRTIDRIKIFRKKEEYIKINEERTLLAAGIILECEGRSLFISQSINILIDPYIIIGYEDSVEQADDLFGTDVTGHRITDIDFEHREVKRKRHALGQPIINIHLDNGTKLRFTSNWSEYEGDMEKWTYTPYFTVEKS